MIYPNGYIDIYASISNHELVNKIAINFSNQYGQYSHTSYLYYNYMTNRFEGTIYASSFYPGKYVLSSIDIWFENSSKTIYRSQLQSIYGINPETLDYTSVKEKNVNKILSRKIIQYTPIYIRLIVLN